MLVMLLQLSHLLLLLLLRPPLPPSVTHAMFSCLLAYSLQLTCRACAHSCSHVTCSAWPRSSKHAIPTPCHCNERAWTPQGHRGSVADIEGPQAARRVREEPRAARCVHKPPRAARCVMPAATSGLARMSPLSWEPDRTRLCKQHGTDMNRGWWPSKSRIQTVTIQFVR